MISMRRPLHQYIFGLLLSACLLVGGYWLMNTGAHAALPVGPALPVPETDSDFVLAEYYFMPEHYDLAKARYHYEEAIRASSTEHVLSWYQLARIDFLEGKFDASLSKLDKQLEYFGDTIPNVYYMKGLVYGFRADWYGRQSDWQEAEVNFLKFIEYMPTSPWARIDLAWIYFSQENYNAMRDILAPIYNEQQANAWYLNMYALALLNSGDTAAAYEHFVRVSEILPTLTPADWAKVYPDNNPADWAQGLEEFKEIVARNTALAAAQQ